MVECFERRAINVLHIVGSLNYGGIETIVRDFVKGFDRDRVKQTVCCTMDEGVMADFIRNEGVCVFKIPYRWNKLFRFIYCLSSLIRVREIDVVHTHIFSANLWVLVAAKLGGARGVVTTIHNTYTLSPVKLLSLKLVNKILGIFSYAEIVCVSDAVKCYSLKKFDFNEKKTSVIHNGINTEKFNGNYGTRAIEAEFSVNNQTLIIGIVASLSEQKNHVMLLRALSEILNKGVDASVVIVGDGVLRGQLIFEVDQLGIGENVIFTGVRDDVEVVLSLLDIFVLCSNYEGLGNVVLEAMSSKVPVIVTDFEAAKEIINDGEDGFIIQRNDYEALAEKIIYLHSNEKIARKISINGRKKVVDIFSINRMMEQYMAVYDRLIGFRQ